jgi:catechol 2,3-dioxygenase-like lactoylglutathione lyase family enzyme
MVDQLPLANLVTLGVRDFHAIRDFYRRLGWPQIMETTSSPSSNCVACC